MKEYFCRAVVAVLAIVGGGSSIAEEQATNNHGKSSASPESRTDVEGWAELVDELRVLPSLMMAKLPETMRNDPQIRQDVARLALASLTGSALETLSSDGDHPFFLPLLNMLTFAGQPNPDTIYRYTYITPGGVYRIRGTKGGMRIASIGEMPRYQMINGVLTPAPIKVYHDINTLEPDAQGRFDVLLSPVRPAGFSGVWWQLQPDTNRLLLRLVSSDWPNEREPTVAIERLDSPANMPRPPAVVLESRLRDLSAATRFLATLFVDKVERLRREGYVNKLKVFDVSQMGGLTGQSYYEGPFELDGDEALIIAAKAPKRCLYRSIMVTNETYDTIDWYNNHSSLNDSQANVDTDGVLRIVLSSRDPGVPNWLDTAGHRRGLIQGRWMGCDSDPVPSVVKVGIAEVRSHLPPETPRITPQERDRIIRERRAALQQRRLW